MVNSEYLKNLNKAQKEAVMHLDGPLLIVAGAGSGKTKVLTSRICHIILSGKATPNQILAVTFTNKAANEMLSRVLSNLKKKKFGMPWVGTFHSICVKILRKHARAADLNYNFTIVDQDDQKKLIKNICKSENIDTKQQVLSTAMKFIDQDIPIASNTSTISINNLARNIEQPDNLIGLHFFAPVERMKLVEVVKGTARGREHQGYSLRQASKDSL